MTTATVSLEQSLNVETIEPLALLLDVGEDHIVAAWELLRSGRGYRSFQVLLPRERTIDAPAPILATLQRRVLRHVLQVGPVSAAAYAGVPGRSHLAAAHAHLESGRQVLHLDVRDAFGSTAYSQVARAFAWRLRRECWTLGLDRSARHAVAAAFAQLVMVRRRNGRGRCLPLGAPTSVATFNLVFLAIDHAIEKLLRDQIRADDLRYTRYLDDLVISRRGPLPSGLAGDLGALLRKHGFALNPAKTTTYTSHPIVHGLQLAGHGIQLAPATQARFVTRIAALQTSLEADATEAVVRQHSARALRGIDGYLRQIYERANQPRPTELAFPLPPLPPTSGPEHLDLLWP